jgi:hypothetical protein
MWKLITDQALAMRILSVSMGMMAVSFGIKSIRKLKEQ